MYRPAHSRRLRGLGSTVVDLINQWASQLGVPSSLAVAVAQRESSLNPNVPNGAAGEIGVFQLMPATAAGLGVDPTDLNQNVQGGVSYLLQMYQKFGNWFQALEAYNAGPGAVSSGRVPSSSQTYATDVLAASGLPSEIPATTPLGTSDTGLLASLDSGVFDFSGSVAPSGGLDPAIWVGVALLGVGLIWWATA
jgi:hypothetical protein